MTAPSELTTQHYINRTGVDIPTSDFDEDVGYTSDPVDNSYFRK